MILLFKIRDASGERKYLITASNLTELTFSKGLCNNYLEGGGSKINRGGLNLNQSAG